MKCSKCGSSYYMVHSCKEPFGYNGLRTSAAKAREDFELFIASLEWDDIMGHGNDWIIEKYREKIKESY